MKIVMAPNDGACVRQVDGMDLAHFIGFIGDVCLYGRTVTLCVAVLGGCWFGFVCLRTYMWSVTQLTELSLCPRCVVVVVVDA